MGDFDGERWVLTPNRRLRWLGWGAVAFGAALTLLMIVGHTGAYGIGSPFFVLGGMAAFLGTTGNLWPARRLAKVHADAAGLHVDGALRLRREDVARAYVQPMRERTLVRVQGKRGAGNVDVAVTDAAEGARVLEALELDAAHRAVTFRTVSPLYATTGRMVLTIGAMFLATALSGFLAHWVGPAATLVIPFSYVTLLAMVFLPTTVTVGADGVLTRWLGWRRFHPYDRVDEVAAYGNGVTLVDKSGKSVRIATAPPRQRPTQLSNLTRDAVRERIDEARRAFAAHTETHAAALVARSGRTTEKWLEALRSLAASADYREAAVPREALWRIAEDPAAEATARAGAAVALRGKLDDADRARLRVAAESSVSPHVRVALEAAATAEDEADVAAALERIDASG
jgi:hypothetical protein